MYTFESTILKKKLNVAKVGDKRKNIVYSYVILLSFLKTQDN